MLQDALARLEHQVQAVEGAVALFQRVDHAQALQVVLEAAVVLHAVVQRVLAGVAERRVAEVVRQRDRFDQVFVQPQRARDRAADLRHLEGMRQPRAEQVALVVQEHLGLVYQAAERGEWMMRSRSRWNSLREAARLRRGGGRAPLRGCAAYGARYVSASCLCCDAGGQAWQQQVVRRASLMPALPERLDQDEA